MIGLIASSPEPSPWCVFCFRTRPRTWRAGPRRRGNGARNRSRRLDAPDPGDVPGHRARRHERPRVRGSWPRCPIPGRRRPGRAGGLHAGRSVALCRSRRRCCDARGVGGSMACSSAKALWQRSPRGSCRGSRPRACTTPPASHRRGASVRGGDHGRCVVADDSICRARSGHRLRVARHDRDCGGLHRAGGLGRGIAHASASRPAPCERADLQDHGSERQLEDALRGNAAAQSVISIEIASKVGTGMPSSF